MFGTNATFDELAATQATIVQYGEDRAFDAIEEAMNAHNAILNEMLDDFCERTTDRQRRYGTPATMTMEDLDEYGRTDVQKLTAGSHVGFPLRKTGAAIQWTRTYLLTARADEMAAQVKGLMDADFRRVTADLKKAIFNPTNYTWEDRFRDHQQVDVKALVNADGKPLPPDPYGGTFDATTHTHYLASNGWTDTAFASVIDTVVEHHNQGGIMVFINRGDEDSVRALSKFTAYTDARIVQPITTAHVETPNVDLMDPY